MARVYDNLQPGASVEWRGLNREYCGTVLRFTSAGWLVRIDGTNKHIIISNNPTRTGGQVETLGRI